MSVLAVQAGVETFHNRVLVVGADHLLDGDDGVGALVVRELQEATWPGHVEIVDGGGSSVRLLDLMRTAPRVILIDAVCDGLWPGTVTCHHMAGPADLPSSLAERDTGLRDLLGSLATLEAMPECDVVTISVDERRVFDGSYSPELATVVPAVSRLVRTLAH